MSIVKNRLAKAHNEAKKATPKNIDKNVFSDDAGKGIENVGAELLAPSLSQQELEMHEAALKADLTALKEIDEIPEKIEYKKQALAKTDYKGFVDRLIVSVAATPNKVLAWFVIWLMDVGRWDEALKYLRVAIKNDQPIPETFTSQNWFSLAIDNMYEHGKKLQEALEKVPETVIYFPDINKFYLLLEFVQEHKPELNEVVAAKLYVIIGKLEEKTGNNGRALNHYLSAYRINEKSGVKTKVKSLAKDFDLNIEV
jgi:tetratricopeptide (TPR) repeat protein